MLADHVVYCREQVRTRKATCRELAKQFGVSEKAIQACVYGHTYAHIPGALKSPKRPAKRRRTRALSEAEVSEIRAAYAAAEKTVAEIAEEYKVSPSYVVRLGRGDARQDIPGGTRNRPALRKARRPIPVRRGESHPLARLDALCVVCIRELVRLGVPHAVIAGIFDTTPENVSMISRRLRWKHVPDMPLTPGAIRHLPPRAQELLAAPEMARSMASRNGKGRKSA